LNLYPPAFFIPVQAVFFALFTIICGGIFFYEFNFNVLQTVMFSLGCFLIFAGVYALAPDHIDLEGYVVPNTARILAVNTDEFIDETSNKILENDRGYGGRESGEGITPRIGVGYGAGLLLTPRDDPAVGGNGEKYISEDSDVQTVAATPSSVPLEFDASPPKSKCNSKGLESSSSLLNRPGTQGTIQTCTSDDRTDCSATEVQRSVNNNGAFNL